MATRVRLLAFAPFVSAVALVFVPSAAAGTLDQSQPGIANAATGFSDTFRDAQTFTSGMTGAVDQVDLAIGRTAPFITASLVVEIRPVSAGVPSGPPLASVTIPAASVPADFFPTTFFSVAFTSPAAVTAGVRYAIVLSSSSCGLANCYEFALGTAGDPYATGSGFFSPDSGATWTPLSAFGSTDFPFKTYVLQGPTSKQQCKKGGWRRFKSPSFKNQGQCVKWVNHRGGKADKAKPDKGKGDKGKKKGGKKK